MIFLATMQPRVHTSDGGSVECAISSSSAENGIRKCP